MVATTDALVPVGIPVLPGAVLSGRYVLGSEPQGRADTLDALPLPGRRLALLVADVVGSGVGAALVVSQLKAILRERLQAGVGLMASLASVDRYAETYPDARGATMCVATLSLEDGEFEWASVGHPPPVLLASGQRPRLLEAPTSRPLGTGGGRLPELQRCRLSIGDRVALFTDGLLSLEDQPLSAGCDRLLEAFETELPGVVSQVPPIHLADELCDRVLSRMLPAHGARDDVALLLLTRSPQPTPFVLEMDAIPESLPSIRHRINQWLDGMGAGLIDHIGLGHAVVELAANAVAHAYRESTLEAPKVCVEAVLEDDGLVRITVSDQGRWREQSSDGRGLVMAAGLADSMEVIRSETGTSVTLTQHLTRSVRLLEQVVEPYADDFAEPADLLTRGETGRLVVSGPIDDTTVDAFETALTEVTRAGTEDAVVDLSGVTHLASPGVQVLFDFVTSSERTGFELCLKAPPDSVAGEVMRLVGLTADG